MIASASVNEIVIESVGVIVKVWLCMIVNSVVIVSASVNVTVSVNVIGNVIVIVNRI